MTINCYKEFIAMSRKSQQCNLKSMAEILSCDFYNNILLYQAYTSKILKLQH